jgi:hypothetical protein
MVEVDRLAKRRAVRGAGLAASLGVTGTIIVKVVGRLVDPDAPRPGRCGS